jgi:putative ABC transport system permease protein
MSWFSGARTRLQLLFGRRAAESRIDEEVRFHLEMETNRLLREEHLSLDEAQRRARATFGGVQQHRETLRDGRGTAWFNGMSLDLKLGFRMLSKYPGLTVVGGLAMALGIWFGAVIFQMYGILSSTKLPLPEGDRIAKVMYYDMKLQSEEHRLLYDYQQYRGLRSIVDLGAYRDASVNIVGADGNAQPAVAAEITSAAFRIAPARPLHGRAFVAADERPGAAPVVVLGYELWRERFAGDPLVVGRSIRVGAGFATVVGVMPEGYAFPMAHEAWLPLRTDVPGVQPRGGFPITVFGRLAPEATFESAQAEVRSVVRRIGIEHPETHAQLQAYVAPYTQMSANPSSGMAMAVLTWIFCAALVAVVCGTVALLLFARAASRETEIIVRSALGASRGRIVGQLFAEALVLAGVSAVVGLATAQLALSRLGKPYLEMNYGRLPFWYDFDLSPVTIVSALMLAVFGAVIAGVLPARKITRGLGTRLRAASAGGGSVSFGGVWTGVIVMQIALTVAFPAVVMLVRSEIKRYEAYDYGFRAQDYLGVTVAIDGPPQETTDSTMKAAQLARYSSSIEALRRRLEGEPEIAGATIVDRLPRDYHISRQVQLVSVPNASWTRVSTASIHPSYFDVLDAPVRSGRAFNSSDAASGARVVIVDQGFVDLVMGGRNPVGHRVRISATSQVDSNPSDLPWHEIVGVVKELGIASYQRRTRAAGLYFPLVPGSRDDLSLMVRGRIDPLNVVPRIRELATAVDPSLRIEQMTRLDRVVDDKLWFYGLWLRVTMSLTGVALLLSLSGIYSVLSYTVARRTREIGVRVALGASARLVITSIFRRPLTQVVLGVIGGSMLIALGALALQRTTEFSSLGRSGLTLSEIAGLIAYAILMVGVCMLACVVPTMRALRVQPTEALRAE